MRRNSLVVLPASPYIVEVLIKDINYTDRGLTVLKYMKPNITFKHTREGVDIVQYIGHKTRTRNSFLTKPYTCYTCHSSLCMFCLCLVCHAHSSCFQPAYRGQSSRTATLTMASSATHGDRCQEVTTLTGPLLVEVP